MAPGDGANIVRAMGIGRVFKDSDAPINSLDFHRTDNLLVTASDDDSIHLYNTSAGERVTHPLFSKKYGVSHIRFTHHRNSVIYASTKAVQSAAGRMDFMLRYHSLHDNQYLRYFEGHTQRITTIAMSPKNDMFMSAAEDRQMRLWDLRTNVCQGLLQAPARPCAAFDQQGLIFCVATDSGVLKLYDIRSYEKGPFDTFTVQAEANTPSTFDHVVLSSDGKLIAAAVGGSLYLLDAFNGAVKARFATGRPDQASAGFEPSFSPDSQFLSSGCEDRCVRTWDTTTFVEIAAARGHAGVPRCCKWAPRSMLMATACLALALWVPDGSLSMSASASAPSNMSHVNTAPLVTSY